MSPTVQNAIKAYQSLSAAEKEEFLLALLSDPALRDDIIAVGLALEAEGGQSDAS